MKIWRQRDEMSRKQNPFKGQRQRFRKGQGQRPHRQKIIKELWEIIKRWDRGE